MNNPERVAALEALLVRIQKNAAKPRASWNVDAKAAPAHHNGPQPAAESINTSNWVSELGSAQVSSAQAAPAPAPERASAPVAAAPAQPTPVAAKPLGFGSRAAAPAMPSSGMRGFGGGAARPAVPKPADSPRPGAVRPGFGTKPLSPAAPPVVERVVERVSPVPPVAAAVQADVDALPIVGARIVAVDPRAEPISDAPQALESALQDPPTLDAPTFDRSEPAAHVAAAHVAATDGAISELVSEPAPAPEAHASPIERMLADVPPPPAPEPAAPPAQPTPGPFSVADAKPAIAEPAPALVAEPAPPVAVHAEPAPAEPPPSFATEDAPSKFAQGADAQPISKKEKGSRVGLLLVALLVLLVGAGVFLYLRSLDQKPTQPLPGATSDAVSNPPTTATATATASAAATATASNTLPDEPSGSASASAASAAPALSTPKDPATLPPTVGYLIVKAPEEGQIFSKGKSLGSSNAPFEISCQGNAAVSFGKKLPDGRMQFLGKPKTTPVKCRDVTTIEFTSEELVAPPPAPPGGAGAPPGGAPPGGTPPGGAPPGGTPGNGDPYEPGAP